MNPRYPQVALRAKHRCEYCHAPEVLFNSIFEVEHVDPSAQGGSNEEENLALACRSCNLNKSNHRNAKDPTSSEVVRLFNPRIDNWDENFTVELDETIRGTTAIGRGTVERLQMNSSSQMKARQCWRILRLFP